MFNKFMNIISSLIRPNKFLFISIIFLLWIITLLNIPNTLELVSKYYSFIFLGTTGAIFANSTGAGGGVVFIPMFNYLGFNEAQSLATSFGIQCFGMTAGAIVWTRYYRQQRLINNEWRPFAPVIGSSAVMSIAGLWTAYGFDLVAPASLNQLFSLFSIFISLAIFSFVFLLRPGNVRSEIELFDYLSLLSVAYVGGLITAWLSVGVGELLAIYLILRRFNVTLAVAAAVVVSAITVWAAAFEQLWLDSQAYWQVLLFAGPGAVIGGIVAKTIVSWLSARNLKLFFAGWLLVIGVWG